MREIVLTLRPEHRDRIWLGAGGFVYRWKANTHAAPPCRDCGYQNRTEGLWDGSPPRGSSDPAHYTLIDGLDDEHDIQHQGPYVDITDDPDNPPDWYEAVGRVRETGPFSLADWPRP
jgi:hypothetical protein